MAVRSLNLAVRSSAPHSNVHLAYTCPVGHTAILKDIRISTPNAGVTRAVVIAHSGAVDLSLVDQSVGQTQAVGWQGWVVLEPGDTLSVYSEGAAALFWLSGAELVGVV